MIRKLKKSEIDSVMSIWLASNREAHPFIPAEYWECNYESVKNTILNADVFVSVENDQIRGFIGLVENYIEGLFVEKTARGKGIGSELIRHAKSIRENLELDVYQENPKAVQFYSRHGFEIVQKTVDPATGHTECRMRWHAVDGILT